MLYEIRDALYAREGETLSARAAGSAFAIRRNPEETAGYRPSFSTDVDRIMHSRAYARYIDKTQVFYLTENDHVTHRMLHVQLVSKIARTVGRFLELNEDLIEAAALGHDIGHAPFGHDGERFLSELCQKAGIGHFLHNVQSVQFLDRVERKGEGLNLTLQTLDGILCHDGEVHERILEPRRNKTFDQMDEDIRAKKKDPGMKLVPMTLEGCLVRMTDTVAYIGRDIEDAIRLGLIRRGDLPADCVKTLGNTNGTIVYRLVSDIISNSRDRDRIAFSEEVSEALEILKAFNLERIYLNPEAKRRIGTIHEMFEYLFETLAADLDRDNRESIIFTAFLEDMSEDYLEYHGHAEIVRDFMAGMTDRYFLGQCPETILSQADPPFRFRY